MKKISLIIATKDRLDLAQRFFTSLCTQTYTNFTVIFVFENTCRSAAYALIQEFSKILQIKPVCTEPCCISKARNKAFPLIDGDYIAFPDDDCIYFPETLANAVQTFKKSPHPDVILARHIDIGQQDVDLNDNSIKKITKFSAFKRSETYLQFYTQRSLHQIGYFDENLGGGTGLPYGCGEDTDYIIRACEQNLRVFTAATVHVAHPAVDFSHPSLQKKVQSYACGRMYLLRKHKFPLWFKLANIAFPLFMRPKEIVTVGKKSIPYRWNMFLSRLKYL